MLDILVCPETRKPVALADGGTISSLNEKIRAGSLRNRGGVQVEKELSEGLLREDGKVLYPIDDGIPVMLIDESIEI
ncbi:MAG: hypothetical protein JRH10_19775 [Deltaproteobacteria bacterium]|nr:hypothetical protein [Deltaproteobacteria bacterium]